MLDKFVVIGKRAAWRVYGKTTVILLLPYRSHRKIDFFELRGAGTFIWKLIEKNPIRVKELIKRSQKKGIKRNALLLFLKDFFKKDIINIVKNPQDFLKKT